MERHPIIREVKERIAGFYAIEFPLDERNYQFLEEKLKDFIFWEGINPYLRKEIKIAKEFLKKIEIGGEYSLAIKQITDGLGRWQVIVYKKTMLVRPGNLHLKNLRLHPKHPYYFYAHAKEFNFALNISVKHPINYLQLSVQRKRDTKELLKLDRKDPLEGHRFFMKQDNSSYPGSGIFIANGNHRFYEIYWRYLAGLLSGDELIEIKNDQLTS